MFFTTRILDLVTAAKDQSFALVTAAKDQSFALAMEAKDNEIRELKKINEQSFSLSITVKENEVAELKRIITGLEAQLKYERAKSDGLVDRLLVRDAKVASVSPAAIEMAKHKDAEAVKRLTAVFDELNSVSAEIPAPSPMSAPRAFEFSGGGSAVAR